jgi:NADH-quinone oxidoreductase subunit N
MPYLNVSAAAPEIALLVTASLLLIACVLPSVTDRIGIDKLALLALVPPLVATLIQFDTPTQYAFTGMYVADGLSHLLKLFCYISVAVAIVYARGYATDRGMPRGELYTLALFALLGQMVMISSNHLLVVYLGLELMSLSLYALAALRRDWTLGSEAAIKYFVLGALSSGFLLYGMSMIYGGTGTLSLPDIARIVIDGHANDTVMVFGVVFLVAGLAFKFGAVPFHMWVPDVYHGTPTATTILIATGPKLAAFAITFRVLAEGMLGVAHDWQQMLMVLAVCSLAIGNLAAIAQTNLKRMLAYSTIGQMGFVLLGLMAGVVNGNTLSAANAYSSAMFYVITYVLTTLASFGIILLLAREGFESEEIADLAGLNQRSPLYAGIMSLCLFSLAGVPPLVGFYAKLAVLQALVASGQALYIALAVYAVIMSLVAAFYYLRVVKVMYFDAPITATTVAAPADVRVVLGINGALILGLGILPGGLMTLCADAIVKTLGT